MENQRLHSQLRDKLHDLESPFNERVSFEAVMKKRERKKRRVILWIPSMVVVAGLFVVGGLGMLWVETDQQPEKSKQVSVAKSIYKPGKAKKSLLMSQKMSSSGEEKIAQSTRQQEIGIGRSKGLWMIPEADVIADNSLESPVISTVEAVITDERPKETAAVSPVTTLAAPVELVEAPVELVQTKDAVPYLNQDMLCDPQGIEKTQLGISDPLKDHAEIPEGEYEAQWDPALLKSKWYAEFSATTGSSVVINFNEDDRLSILGNIYHANYHGLILKDVGKGFMVGLGLSYGEMVGTGEWRVREFEERMSIDTYDVVVMLPPVQTVRVYDTTYSQVRVETVGMLNFRIDKYAIPMAVRYNFMLGKMAWRAAAQVNPGLTIKTAGDFFTNTEYTPIASQKNLTLDMKLAVGPTISIFNNWFLVLEPNMMHHTFRDMKSGVTKGKTLTGFGVSVLHHV
ncbi:MAG: hypothetical protein ACKOI1_04140 [Bacteroidota bacterium]